MDLSSAISMGVALFVFGLALKIEINDNLVEGIKSALKTYHDRKVEKLKLRSKK